MTNTNNTNTNANDDLAFDPTYSYTHKTNQNITTDFSILDENPKWKELYASHELAYFRGELAASSPESYTTDEMREISVAMFASTAEVEVALRADFASMPPRAQAAMLELLQKADPDNFQWWLQVLSGKTPDSPEEVACATA